MPLVTLTENQIQMAHVETERLITDSNTRGLQHRFDPTKSAVYRYENHFQAAVSEIAVSTFLGLPWTSTQSFKGSDVSGYEVRSQKRKDGKQYCLLVRGNDKTAIYIFCVVDTPNVVISGWATDYEVRNNGVLLYEDTDCYGLRREELHPMWQLDEVTEFASRHA